MASAAGQAEQTAADQTELAQLAGSAQAESAVPEQELAGRVPEMAVRAEAVLVGAWPELA